MAKFSFTMMYPFTVVATETADAVTQTVRYIPNPFFSALGIAIGIGTCIGIAAVVRNPAFVKPVANVRMQGGDCDEADQTIQGWFVAGFGFSLAAPMIPTLTQFFPVVGLALFCVLWFLGAVIGSLLWILFRVVFLRVVQGHRRLAPWMTVRSLCCQQCRQPLQLIASSASPNQVLNYLSPVERMASGQTQFAVWHCPVCYPDAKPDRVHLRGYRDFKAAICPRCRETTLSKTGSYPDWQGDSEYEVTTFVCRYCSAETSKTRFVQGGDPS